MYCKQVNILLFIGIRLVLSITYSFSFMLRSDRELLLERSGRLVDSAALDFRAPDDSDVEPHVRERLYGGLRRPAGVQVLREYQHSRRVDAPLGLLRRCVRTLQ